MKRFPLDETSLIFSWWWEGRFGMVLGMILVLLERFLGAAIVDGLG